MSTELETLRARVRELEAALEESRGGEHIYTYRPLLDSERLALSVMEQSGEAILVCDRNEFVPRANDLARALCHGEPESRLLAEVLHIGLEGHAPGPADTAELRRRIDAVMAADSALRGIEATAVDETGGLIHLQLSGTPLRNQHGAVIGCVLILTDVTALRNAQRQAREGAAQLAAFSDSASAFGIFRLRVDPQAPRLARVELATPSMRDLGVEPTAPFEHWLEAVHPDDRARTTAASDTAIRESRRFDEEMRLYVADREEWRWLHVVATPVFNAHGRATHFNGVILDVTDRKRAEQALMDSELRQRTLLDTIPDLVWLKDPDGLYLGCNSAFERLLGANEAEIIGKTDYNFVDKDLADFFRANDRAAIDACGPRRNQGWITFASDDRRALLDTTKTPVYDSAGGLWGVLGIARDITDLHRAQEELARSEAHFRLALETTKTGSWEYDIASSRVRWSVQVEGIWGLRPGSFDGSLEKVRAAIHPHDLATWEEDVRACIEDGERHDIELRVIHRDGSVHWVHAIGDTERDDQGQAVRMLGLVRDVTEQRRIRDALRAREHKLDGIFRASPVGIALMVDRTFQEVNDSVCAIIGYSRDELLGQSARILYTNEAEFERVGQAYDQITDSESVQVETRMRRKGGELIDVLLSATLLDPAHPQAGVISIALDITERKRAEKKLREREEHLRTLLDTIPDLVWMKDPEGRYLSCNASYAAFLGSSEGEIVGRTDYDLYEHERAEFYRKNDGLAIAAGKPRMNEEDAIYPDGRVTQLETIKAPVYDPVGTLAGVLGIGRDITKRKRAEEALRKSEQKFRLVTETIDDVFWISTPGDERLLYVNPGYETLWGRPCQALYQKPRAFLDAVHPEDLPTLIEILDVYHAHCRPYQCEYRITRPDGELRWVRERGFPVDEAIDGQRAMAGVCTDITGFKQNEQRLLEAGRAALMGHWELDIASGRGRWSDEVHRILGTDPDRPVGLDLLATIVHPEDWPVFNASLEEAMRDGTPHEVEYRVRRQDGAERWLYCRAVTELDADGRPLRLRGIAQDVTEKKRVEIALRDNVRRLELLTASLPGLLYQCRNDHRWTMQYLSQGCAELLGYKPEDFIGNRRLGFADIIHPDDRERVWDEIQVGLKRDGEFRIDYRVVTAAGEVKWVLERGVPLDDEHETLLGLVLDNDARRRAEQASEAARKRAESLLEDANRSRKALLSVMEDQKRTQEQLRKLAQAVEQSPESIVITNRDAEIEYVNAAFQQASGYTAEEVIGQNPRILKSGKTPSETYAELWRALVDGRSWAGEFVNRRKDGSEYTEHAVITPLRQADGSITHFVGVKEDITAKKRDAEELDRYRSQLEELVAERTLALREAEMKYRTVADFTYDWEIWVDNAGNWLYCSPASERVTGYPAADFIADPGLLLELAVAEDRPALIDHMHHQELASGVGRIEFRIHRRDGEERWLEDVCRPVLDAAGRVSGRRASNRDITERKDTEQALVAARDAADAANRSKSQFLANMSHEIRTPMNAILGLTHLMQHAGPTPEQADRLAKIEYAGTHLLEIINDILDLSKIESGKLRLVETDTRLSAVFDHVQSMVRDEIRRKGLTLAVDTDGVPEWIRCDPTRLRQALLNYVSNAVKFTERGGIVIRAIKLAENEGGLLVCFEVEDTGIGIAADKLDTVFEPFEQVDSTSTRRFGGTGLGLAITRRLVELMGGEVGVKSEPGRGSLFWFTARLHPGVGIARERAKEPAGTGLAAAHAGARLLVVEDNDLNREVAEDILRNHGFEVETACDGREALSRIEAACPDLVLMDVQMPEMDGYEATRAIRALPVGRELPVLAMTANVFEDDRRACMDAGMNDFIAKPIDPDVLVQTIVKWLPGRATPHTVGPPAVESDQAPVETPTSAEAALAALKPIQGLNARRVLARLRGDPALVTRLLRQFETAHRGDVAKMRERLAAGDHEGYAALLHTLKGAAATIGLEGVAAKAAELQGSVRAGTGKRASRIIETGLTDLENALSDFATALASLPANPEGTKATVTHAGWAEVNAILQELDRLLGGQDASANSLFFDEEARLRAVYGDAIDSLRSTIEMYKYRDARSIVARLVGNGAAKTEDAPGQQ